MKTSHQWFSFVVALLMILPFFPSVSQAEALESYIVNVDVERMDPAYAEAVSKDDLSKAVRIANAVLDRVEAKITEGMKVEVTGRVQLVLPSLFLRAASEDAAAIRRMEEVSDVFKDLKFESGYVGTPSSGRSFGRDEQSVLDSEVAKLRHPGRGEDDGASTDMIRSAELIGLEEDLHNRYDGKGSVLGVIDANMDPSHFAYYLNDSVQPRLKAADIDRLVKEGSLNTGKYATLSNLYRSAKIPFGWNYMNKDADLNEEDEVAAHGQHVSGTVAGNAVSVNGEKWKGVAPNAQLLMMNVMRNGSTSASLYLQAMQDSMVLGADAVNMSLGATKGVAGEPNVISEAFDKGFSKNTNFVVAAGNEGEYQGDLNIDTPDYGTVATPGVYRTALTVASLENKTMAGKFLYLSGVPFTYFDTQGYTFPGGEYEYVHCGWGRPEDFDGKNLQGKVALIERGKLTFTDKVSHAQRRGAVGAIIYNNVPGIIKMEVDTDRVRIPSISVSQEDGKAILSSPVRKFLMKDEVSFVPNPEYGEISGFSNWGLTAEGYLKPDITAPGGNILSLQNKGDTFGSMSGTSMATPHVTGAIGVLRQYMRESRLYRDIPNKAELTKILLMNAAVPHRDPVTGFYTSPRRQGAGVLNMANAVELDYTVVMQKDRVPSGFIGNVTDELHFDVEVKNYSDRWRVLTPVIDATIEAKEGRKLLLRPEGLFSTTLYDQKISVAPGATKRAHIKVPIQHLEKLSDFDKGGFVEGFLRFFDRKGKYATVAFVSYVGDFGKLHSIEKPIYEFDFSKEKPIYWNTKFRQNAWHKYSTHVETEVGTHEDEFGTTVPTEKIMGMKNFDEVNQYKNTPDEPKPEFEPLVFSPNKDGYNDKFRVFSVVTRGSVIRTEVVDEYGDVLESREDTYPKSISFLPDEAGHSGYRGYHKLYELTQQYDDGKYTLRIVGRALNEHGTEPNPETVDEIPFQVDQKAPSYQAVEWNENRRVLSFSIQEDSFLREVKASYQGALLPIEKRGDRYELTIPASHVFADVRIEAVDGGYNRGIVSMEELLRPQEFGRLNVLVKTGGAKWPVELEYRILNAEGKEMEKNVALKAGEYRLTVDGFSYKYELKSEREIPFEIEAGEETTVSLDFELKNVERLALKIDGLDGLNPYDVKVWAVSKRDGHKILLHYKNYLILRYFEEYVPVGVYTFETEFREGVTGYRMKISHDEYTVKPGTREQITISAEKFDVNSPYKIRIQSNDPEQEFIILQKGKYGQHWKIGADALRPGDYAVLPVRVKEGTYVYPPVQELSLDDDHPSKEISFQVKPLGNAGFMLTMEDNYPAGKYQIEDLYSIYGVKGGLTREMEGKSVFLTPGKYRITAIPDEDRHGWPSYQEEKHPVIQSENDAVSLRYEWQEYDPTKKSAVLLYLDQQELYDHAPKTKYKFSLKPKKGDIIRDTWYLPSVSMMIPYGSYTPFVEGLPEGFSIAPKTIPVYEPIQDIFLSVVRVMPELENKGRAIWNYTYKGTREIDPEVKLYRVEENGTETFVSKPQRGEVTELEYGNYVYILSPPGEDFVVNDDRLEFTISKEKQWFRGNFEISVRKKKFRLNITQGDRELKKLHVRLMNDMGDEVIAEYEEDGYYFFGNEGEEYEIEIYTDEDAVDEYEGLYYPNRVKIEPNQAPISVRVGEPVDFTIHSVLVDGEKKIDPSYRIEWKNGNQSYVTFYEDKVPYIEGDHQTFVVEYSRFDRDKFYILGDSKQEVVIESQDKSYELTFRYTSVSPEVDKSELVALIEEYNIIRKTLRYANTEKALKQAYDDAIDEAIRVKGNKLAKQEEVNELVRKIKEKRDAVVGSPLEAAKEELSAIVGRDDAVRAGKDFQFALEEAKETYVRLIEEAKSILDGTTPTTDKEIYALIKKINEAVEFLVGVYPVVRAELKTLIDEADEVMATPLYMNATDAKKREYEVAVFTARNRWTDPKTTEEVMLELIKNIKEAKSNLDGVAQEEEESEAPRVTLAYENDVQVEGMAPAKAEVYAEVNGTIFGPSKANGAGRYAISVERLRTFDKVYVYAKEHSKRPSEKMKVSILPMDKEELRSLVSESDWFKKSSTYRRALPAAKDKYDKSIAMGRRYLRERDIVQKDILDAIKQIKAAKEFLASAQKTGKGNTETPFSRWTAIAGNNAVRRPYWRHTKGERANARFSLFMRAKGIDLYNI